MYEILFPYLHFVSLTGRTHNCPKKMHIFFGNILLSSLFLFIPMFLHITNSADDFADDLLPENNEDLIEHPMSGTHNRNVKRDALLVNILIDIMDRFYVSKKIYAKRPQDEESIARDKIGE